MPFYAGATTIDDDQDVTLVGRIVHMEGGALLRYVAEDNDWVATVTDAPFGLEDALYAENGTRAECSMPNGTWIRVGGNTQIQMIALTPETTTVDVASGLVRMYNKNQNAVIKAMTPFGYVVAPEGAVFDLYVGDESLEVITVRGNVDFVHETTQTRYTVQERDASLIADNREASLGNGTVDTAWDNWNGQRDMLWARRLNTQGQEAEYLPEPIRDEAYVLAENGRWEQVYYEGDYYTMWRPTSIEPGWKPFTEGRWTVYYGDNCWIPTEPFGYVTHHYGSWLWLESFRRWYWLPPVTRIATASPGLFVPFGWYPGRVGWIHSGSTIGWVPLAPHEEYYCHRPWGRSVVVINQDSMVDINISRYRYLDRAVIISRDHLYRGNRYTPFVQRFDRRTIINKYKPAAVLNRNVIRTYDTDKRRFAFNDVQVGRKPHATVLNRINNNQRIVRDTGNIGRQQIRQDLDRTPIAALSTAATVRAPAVSNRMVPAGRVNQSVETVSFPQKELKPNNRQRQIPADSAQVGQRGQRLPVPGQQNDVRRMRSTRDARDTMMQNNSPATPAPATERLSSERQPAVNQGRRAPVGQENERRIRSPRETESRRPVGPPSSQRLQPRGQETNQQRMQTRGAAPLPIRSATPPSAVSDTTPSATRNAAVSPTRSAPPSVARNNAVPITRSAPPSATRNAAVPITRSAPPSVTRSTVVPPTRSAPPSAARNNAVPPSGKNSGRSGAEKIQRGQAQEENPKRQQFGRR